MNVIESTAGVPRVKSPTILLYTYDLILANIPMRRVTTSICINIYL